MNLAEAKKKALSLMAEYSVDGVLVPDEENIDYTNRFNRFANDAQMEISDKLPIETSFTIMQTASTDDGYNKYDLPVELKQFKYINLNDERFSDYRIENRKLLVRKCYDGTIELFYEKYPTELDDITPDTYEFEIPKHTHSLIPYYLGGMASEKVEVSDKLLNMFYNKLNTISHPINETANSIQNVYGW